MEIILVVCPSGSLVVGSYKHYFLSYISLNKKKKMDAAVHSHKAPSCRATSTPTGSKFGVLSRYVQGQYTGCIVICNITRNWKL